MRKALHLRDDVDRQYVSRKEGGRGLASIKNSFDDIGKHERGLVTAIRNDTDNTMNNTITITRKQKWDENNSMGVFKD